MEFREGSKLKGALERNTSWPILAMRPLYWREYTRRAVRHRCVFLCGQKFGTDAWARPSFGKRAFDRLVGRLLAGACVKFLEPWVENETTEAVAIELLHSADTPAFQRGRRDDRRPAERSMSPPSSGCRAQR